MIAVVSTVILQFVILLRIVMHKVIIPSDIMMKCRYV